METEYWRVHGATLSVYTVRGAQDWMRSKLIGDMMEWEDEIYQANWAKELQDRQKNKY